MTNLEEQFQSEAVVADRQVHNTAENEGEIIVVAFIHSIGIITQMDKINCCDKTVINLVQILARVDW